MILFDSWFSSRCRKFDTEFNFIYQTFGFYLRLMFSKDLETHQDDLKDFSCICFLFDQKV